MALHGLAALSMTLKDYVRAERLFARLTDADARDWYAWLGYGDAQAQQGHTDAAVRCWRQAAYGDLPAVSELAQQRLSRYTPLGGGAE